MRKVDGFLCAIDTLWAIEKYMLDMRNDGLFWMELWCGVDAKKWRFRGMFLHKYFTNFKH